MGRWLPQRLGLTTLVVLTTTSCLYPLLLSDSVVAFDHAVWHAVWCEGHQWHYHHRPPFLHSVPAGVWHGYSPDYCFSFVFVCVCIGFIHGLCFFIHRIGRATAQCSVTHCLGTQSRSFWFHYVSGDIISKMYCAHGKRNTIFYWSLSNKTTQHITTNHK